MFSHISIVLLNKVYIFYAVMTAASGQLVPSCVHQPCRYLVGRTPEDAKSELSVSDTSSHSVNWSWEVRGGKWNVTYLYTYPTGWYEGWAVFINCTSLLDGREQAFVSWGSHRPWESNAIPIVAAPWNITYNGDIFGFVPTDPSGKYIFRIYTKNKRHNPFTNEEIIEAPGSCSWRSSDKTQLKAFYNERKKSKNCDLVMFEWDFLGNNGRWRIIYQWDSKKERFGCAVFYGRQGTGQEEKQLIEWSLDLPKQGVSYRSGPIPVHGEAAWVMDLSPEETWGFSPTGQGAWVFQHFSRNLVFQPFKT